MANVIILGDYFPKMTYKTLLNQYLLEMNNGDDKFFLVSNAWCEISNENFIGSMNELTRNGNFTKRYYVDPLQLKYSQNKDAAILGLICDVIKKENIDIIKCTNCVNYSIILDNIKRWFPNIQIEVFISRSEVIVLENDLYWRNIFGDIKQSFDTIWGIDFYTNEIPSIINYSVNRFTSKEIIDRTTILGLARKYQDPISLAHSLHMEGREFSLDIILFGENKKLVADELYDAYGLNLVDVKDMASFYSVVTKGTKILDISMFLDYIDLAPTIIEYLCGYYPIINSEVLNALHKEYKVNYSKLKDKFILTNIEMI